MHIILSKYIRSWINVFDTTCGGFEGADDAVSRGSVFKHLIEHTWSHQQEGTEEAEYL